MATFSSNSSDPGEIMVGDTALADWIYMLSATAVGQQELINSLMNGSQTSVTRPNRKFWSLLAVIQLSHSRGEKLILYLEGEEENQSKCLKGTISTWTCKRLGCSNEGSSRFFRRLGSTEP